MASNFNEKGTILLVLSFEFSFFFLDVSAVEHLQMVATETEAETTLSNRDYKLTNLPQYFCKALLLWKNLFIFQTILQCLYNFLGVLS